ncbi:MAG: hypothetical protein ACFFCL_09730 [Promethearchaeota archaeon]
MRIQEFMQYLPCKKCGSGLPIVKGSVAQCPYCGAKTLYMESICSFKYYLAEVLNLTSFKTERLFKNSEFKAERVIKNLEIDKRKSIIESHFHRLYSDFNEYRHLIITKLDSIDIDPLKLFNLIRSAGNFEIIIEEFLLNYIKDDKIREKYQDCRDFAFLINKSLLGLYYSYLAKNSLYVESCENYYHLAEKNYKNIVDYCNIIKLENNHHSIYEKKEIYEVLSEFTAILRGILNKNPKFYSDKLEDLLNRLAKVKIEHIRKFNLYSQIENIYQLERNTCVLLEKVKIDNPFSSTDTSEENIIFNSEENLEKLNNVRNWIKVISERYQKYQRNLLKLHSGRLIRYLESYREEFINFKNKNVEKFNNLLEEMILKTFNAYNSEAVEVLNSLSDLIQKDILNENIIKRFEVEHKDLIHLDELLKNFIKDIFNKPVLRNFKSEYCKKLISHISVKHTEFDKYILKYVNRIFQNFEEIRSKKILSLEEQKNQFSLELKPSLQKLIDLSFNLDEKVLPYPLFIDIEVQNEKLKVDSPEVITLIIENPNLTSIKDIKIYFFMPNTFQSKLEYTSIKKLKPNERRKIKTKIIPKQIGTFLFMVMVEYQHTNKTFWMPSIKHKLTVEESEGLLKYSYYPKIDIGIYHNGIEAPNTDFLLKYFIKNLVC